MKTMDNKELGNPDIFPENDVLKTVLGTSFSAYVLLLELYKQNKMEYEWRYYKDGKVWLCKVQYKKRTIVWMSARNGYVEATIYFSDTYINGVYELDISDEIIKTLKQTQNGKKLKPCTFKITEEDQIKDFNKVMQLKLSTK